MFSIQDLNDARERCRWASTHAQRDAEVQARAKAVCAQRAVNRELDAKVEVLHENAQRLARQAEYASRFL